MGKVRIIFCFKSRFRGFILIANSSYTLYAYVCILLFSRYKCATTIACCPHDVCSSSTVRCIFYFKIEVSRFHFDSKFISYLMHTYAFYCFLGTRTTSNTFLVAFDQNFAGTVRIRSPPRQVKSIFRNQH